MRRLYQYLILCGALLLASCDIVTSDNGQLDGLWQLRTIDNLRSGRQTDGRDADVQWAFQGSLLMLQASTGTQFDGVFCSFSHEGSRLLISAPYFSGRFIPEIGDDVRVDNPEALHIYGLYRLEEDFRILQLDGKNMLLESDSTRLHFRRY